MITIALADDESISRDALRCLLERERDFRVVGDVGGRDAVRLAVRRKPRVLIVRAALPGPSGIEITREVHEQAPGTQVIMISRLATEWHLLAALRSGAAGYLSAVARERDLSEAIRRVAAGAYYLSPPFSRYAVETWLRRSQAADAGDPLEILTPREREVLRLVAEGQSSTKIAQCLSISPRTAESHRANVMRKLRLSSYVQLIRFALLRGILPIVDRPYGHDMAPRRSGRPGKAAPGDS
jgi:DNA-binding NarL/FixJ family response regulator